ncbi:MAG: hypothetical protein ACI4MG_03030 [Aristaeellaceae bacterium]
MRRILLILLCFAMVLPALAEAPEDEEYSLWDVVPGNSGTVIAPGDSLPTESAENAPADDIPADQPEEEENPPLSAREDFIERIISMGHDLYVKANGKAQRAYKKGDIYLCKNFTTHIFNELRDDFCIAEYPDVKLRIPNNLPSEDCKPYYYGLAWEEVSAEKGNPFYEAAAFRYDKSLTMEENFRLACDFMRQVQRGDFFQMSADYEYGVGAHSAIMMGYDAQTDEIHWMDSNMRGYKNSQGIRYGICQYDEVRSVEWWATAFCVRGRGATLYRLRDDIAYRE